MTDVPRFPVLEAADGYEIAEVDRQVWQLCEEIRRGRRTGLHPGPFDTRPFRLVHRSQVYAPGAVDDWFDGCSAELEARRQHPSAHRPPPYEGDLDDPPELRGTDRPGAEPEKFESSIPPWARVVALLVIVGLVCAYVLSYF